MCIQENNCCTFCSHLLVFGNIQNCGACGEINQVHWNRLFSKLLNFHFEKNYDDNKNIIQPKYFERKTKKNLPILLCMNGVHVINKFI